MSTEGEDQPVVKDANRIANLVGQRSQYRGQITKQTNAIESAIEANDEQTVKTKFAILNVVWKKLCDITDTLRDSADADNLGDEISKEIEYVSKFESCKIIVESFLSNTDRPRDSFASSTKLSVKLEKLPLPKFDGNPLTFVGFWDAFQSRVHRNTNLSNIDKLQYLRASLSGEVKNLIEGLDFSSEGYNEAMDLLKTRYYKRKPLVSSHIFAINQLEKLADNAEVVDIRRCLDSMNIQARALRSLGLDIQLISPGLFPLMLAKFPLWVRVAWEENLNHLCAQDNNKDPDDPNDVYIFELLEFISKQLDNREKGIMSGSSLSTMTEKRTVSLPKRISQFTRNVPVSLVTQSSPLDFVKVCLICQDKTHYLPKDCKVFQQADPDKRHKLVKISRLCFNCLSPKHTAKNCNSNNSCFHCKQHHHSMLCQHKTKVSRESGTSPATQSKEVAPGNAYVCVNRKGFETSVVMQTFKALAVGPKNTQVVRVLVDGGSNLTFVKRDVVRKLRLPITSRSSLAVSGFAQNAVTQSFEVCSFELVGLTDRTAQLDIRAHVCGKLCHPLPKPRIELSKYPHLKGLTLADDFQNESSLKIDILLGADYLYEVLGDQVIRGPKGTPVAVNTKFGWTVHGPYGVSSLRAPESTALPVLFCHTVEDRSPLELLSSLDLLGISAEEPEHCMPAVKVVENRFEVPLSWKSDFRPKCNVSEVKRVQMVRESKMPGERRQVYDRYFKEFEESGIIERCDPPSAESWYLPHHGVWKSGKLRVVFDGSFGQPPLNALLKTGPNMLSHLPICLTSFRLFEIPLCADIEKAFLQIRIPEVDRDFLRFLWGTEHYRFIRVPFGLASSPWALNASLDHLFSSQGSQFDQTILVLRESMYVDDLVASVKCEVDFQIMQEQCQVIFSEVSMNLRNWSTRPDKVLGLDFEAESDNFQVNLQNVRKMSGTLTRRKLVASVAKVFDPLGLATPWLLRGKLLIKEAWKNSNSWDEPLPESIAKRWNEFMREALECPVLLCPRWLRFYEGAVLHIFSDASELSFASCAYLVSERQSLLIYSRNRLSPERPSLTIPKLELMGCVLSVRIAKFLRKGLPRFEKVKTVFWSDSQVVLGWLKKIPETLPNFVASRVREIQSVEGEWRFCEGVDNPADLSTRVISAADLIKSKWMHGPEWLISSECDWPQSPVVEEVSSVFIVQSETADNLFEENLDRPIAHERERFEGYLRRFSSLTRIVKVTAFIFRFLGNIRKQLAKSEVELGPLSADEKSLALTCLIKRAQQLHFFVEYTCLSQGLPIPRSSGLIPLKVRISDEVIVAIPRTGEPEKLVIPNKTHLSKLLIWNVHISLYHAGIDRILCELQRKYWVIAARRVIRSQISKCVPCQRFKGKSYAHPTGYLAPFRTECDQPFQHTGLDHTGPIKVKTGEGWYVLLFTCASTRAVHLEVVTGLSSEVTALAIRRFFARRGKPDRFYSDNARSFRQLASLLDVPWNFIPERSPWWGGWWERLIGTLKRSLRKTLHLSSLNAETLYTVIVELEGVINNRPLTYVSNSPDSWSPLRPIDFLRIRSPLSSPWASESGECLRRQWRHGMAVSRHLNTRWKQEYLTSLRQWRDPKQSGKTPSVGDVVLVKDSGHPCLWPLARVDELIISPIDGICRAVFLSVRGKCTRRDTSLLVPLESEPPWSNLPRLKVQKNTGDSIRVESSSVTDSRVPVDTDSHETVLVNHDVPKQTKRGRVVKLPARFKD